MSSHRFFIVFFVSTLIFLLFILLSFYTLFYSSIQKDLNHLQYINIKSAIDSLYLISKYDLQNIIRDSSYIPVSAIYRYSKKDNEVSYLNGKVLLDKNIDDVLSSNIKNIVFLEEGFGYILPYIKEKFLYIFVAIERGDDIYISVNGYTNNDNRLRLCCLLKDKSRGETDLLCNNKAFVTVYDKKFFSIKMGYEGKYNLKFFIYCVFLFILVAIFLSYWVSRHFDLEERRIISEIQSSIEAIEKGYSPLINIRSPYILYKRLIEEINHLIQKLTSEIDKHKVIYNQYFKEEERNKGINESAVRLLNLFTKDFSDNDYMDFLKSMDMMLKENNGGLRFKGVVDDCLLVRKLAFVMLELVSHRKGYYLIIEAERGKVDIISENIDFEIIPDSFALYNFKDVYFEKRRITIYGYEKRG